MKLAQLNVDGSVFAFYDPVINSENLPGNLIEITDDQWGELLEGQAFKRLINGDITDISQPADPKHTLIGYAAEMRWQKEVAGFELNGLRITTDDRSKLMLAGARAAAETNPNFTTQWKSADNSFVNLNAQELITISNAVLAHVSNCFSIEAQVLASINDGLITEPAQIDSAFA